MSMKAASMAAFRKVSIVAGKTRKRVEGRIGGLLSRELDSLDGQDDRTARSVVYRCQNREDKLVDSWFIPSWTKSRSLQSLSRAVPR